MRRVHQDLVVLRGVVLRHGVVRVRRCLIMKTSRRGVLQRVSLVVVLVSVVSVLRPALLARMRLLGRVSDIVVRCYSVVARQCVSDAWVPPERTALDGRRTLDGKYLSDWGPSGLLLWRGLWGGRSYVA